MLKGAFLNLQILQFSGGGGGGLPSDLLAASALSSSFGVWLRLT